MDQDINNICVKKYNMGSNHFALLDLMIPCYYAFLAQPLPKVVLKVGHCLVDEIIRQSKRETHESKTINVNISIRTE